MKKVVALTICYGVIFVLVLCSKGVASGVASGIQCCVTLVIPSLFIFMVVGNFVASSRLCEIISAPFAKIGQWAFGLDRGAMAIYILSLVGGYPIGARMLGKKVTQGEISVTDAEDMLCYCVNCGPAFLVSGVGLAMLGNAKIGAIIYLAQVVASIVIAVLRRGNVRSAPKRQRQSQGFSSLLVNSVSDSVKAMASVCGLILCFSVLISVVGGYFGSFAPYVSAILEVTTAIKALSTLPNAAVLITIFTAFGGVCVHMQIAAMLANSGVRLGKFLKWRLLYAAISGSLVFGWLRLFPEPANCINISTSITPLQTASPTATIFLILLSIMLLFFCKKFDRI